MFLRMFSTDILQTEKKTKNSASPFCGCLFRLSLKLKHYHCKILNDDGSSPRLSEDMKSSGCCLGREKAFFPLSPRGNSSLLFERQVLDRDGKKEAKSPWLSHRPHRLLDFLQSVTV